MTFSYCPHRYNEERFRRQIDKALAVVKNILDTTRTPCYAADQDHAYDDKYGLAEFLGNAALAAQLNVLEGVGLDGTKLGELRKIATEEKRSATLRFEAEETCEFVEEKVVDVEGKHAFVSEVEESTTKGGSPAKAKKTTTTHRVVTKVTEYHWRVGLEYVVYVYVGSDPSKHAAVLQRRASHVEIITTGSKDSPLPARARSAPVDAPLTWLLENVSAENQTCGFSIDRTEETCRTPRRNENVEDALTFFTGMKNWAQQVRGTLVHNIEENIIVGMSGGGAAPSVEPEAKVRLSSVDDEEVFVPVLPLFENQETDADGGGAAQSSPLLPVSDVNLFLAEQRRSLDEKVAKLQQFFPPKEGEDMISSAEAILVLLALHTEKIADHFADGVDYIENMLKTQLIKAIGKEVQPSDFEEFVRFHDKRLLNDKYAPEPFAYAIRIPNHCPNGAVSIEKCDSGESTLPIMSLTKKLDGERRPMFLPINAATSVELGGDLFLHAWVSHRFAGQQEGNYRLVARARQFSSFLLLVGKISGPGTFEPLDAIILQNKDEVLIPLLLNQLPTPKEFKDAISSLSPEQKRFATAFRNMQLESSVFAVCCIQLKPQLEALLGLPADSLTKEIKLTEDLLSLFIEYQIPSDLMSFDGADDMSASDKVGNVRGHVESVLKVIEDSKDKDLQAAQKEADMAFELKQAASPPSISTFGTSSPGMFASPAPAMATADSRGGGFGSGARRLRAASCNRGARGAGPPQEMMMRKAAPVMAYSAPPPPPDAFAAMASVDADSREKTVPEAHTEQTKQVIPKQKTHDEGAKTTSAMGEEGMVDFTQIPKKLDSKFEELDTENALCATVIKTKETWTKKFQRNLLTKPEEMILRKKEQRSERDKAFDLLDALSRSGSLRVDCAELHIIVAATHNFDHSLMETVIQDNVNPIEKMEQSTLIVASTIHGVAPEEMLRDDSQVSRVKKYSPGLFSSSE